MREKLYWTIEKFSLRFDYFMFFDVESYLADQLFIKHKVRVWFGDEYKRVGSPFLAIFCKVKKKDVPAFLEALEELKKSMLICGYLDYEQSIDEFMTKIEKTKEEEKRHGNGPLKKAKQATAA